MAERLLRSTVNTLFIGSIPINAFNIIYKYKLILKVFTFNPSFKSVANYFYINLPRIFYLRYYI